MPYFAVQAGRSQIPHILHDYSRNPHIGLVSILWSGSRDTLCGRTATRRVDAPEDESAYCPTCVRAFHTLTEFERSRQELQEKKPLSPAQERRKERNSLTRAYYAHAIAEKTGRPWPPR
jgi:hypothetical protein